MNKTFLSSLSIIIPLATGETHWKSLLPHLRACFGLSEILLVSKNNPIKHETQYLKWVPSDTGRAKQLNAGAKAANHDILWFLHADTLLQVNTLEQLEQSFRVSSDSLLFFGLHFYDGSSLMKVNELGLNFRSRFLKMPFGDQGFAIKKDLFNLLYGYDETLPYGEDHHFVWKCHQSSISVKRIKHTISTSARKYQNNWSQITAKHLYLTYKQAIPEFFKMIKGPKKTALACFVKTPGVSPLKTRLAESIGRDNAETFHVLSCQCIERTLLETQKNNSLFFPFWSVAETNAQNHPLWKNLFTMTQASGTLGDRLHYTYQKLREIYKNVIFIGADSPQITPDLIQETIDKLKDHDFVLGPAEDGGYYLFAGKKNLSHQDWLDVPYSSELTCEKFKAILEKKGNVALLQTLVDVDTKEELEKLKEQITSTELNEFIKKVVN